MTCHTEPGRAATNRRRRRRRRRRRWWWWWACGGGVDRVVDQRDGAVARQRSPVQRDAGVDRDRRQGEDRAGKRRGRSECRGAPDLPEHVAGLRAADQVHVACDRSRQRRTDLEHEHGVGIALTVERQRAGQPQRGCRAGLVDARSERPAADVGRQRLRRLAPSGVVVRGREITLRVQSRTDRPHAPPRSPCPAETQSARFPAIPQGHR